MSTGFQNRHFRNRLEVTDAITEAHVQALYDIGHIVGFEQATEEEDKNQGIDWFFDYPNGDVHKTVQFKLRMDPRHPDFPILYSQPNRGFGHETTKVGRDFKGIVEHRTDFVYVGVKNQSNNFSWVNQALCTNLEPLVLELEKEWEEVKGYPAFYAKGYFSPQRVAEWMNEHRVKCVYRSEKGGEVWWQKNSNEAFGKFNFYLPASVRDQQIMLPSNFTEAYLTDVPEKDR